MKNSASEVPGSALAELWGVTPQAVSLLEKRGVIARNGRRFDRDESTRCYCAHLRQLATGRGGEGGIASAAAERARLIREQADAQAMKNAVARGEVLDAGEVERKWSEGFREVRSAMLAVPSRCAGRLPYLSRSDVSLIDQLVREALRDVGEGK
jgi:terminase small subunit / prophage DNA-packing protein